MTYVDGFIIAVPKSMQAAYVDIAKAAGALWIEHGAIGYAESAADDLAHGELTSFPRAVQASEEEVVYFSWTIFQSKESRNTVNANVMADARMKDIMANMPFDMSRMVYGGFETVVKLSGSVSLE